MGSIQPIDKASVHRIASGQVIVDLPSAVKEIVENSIDAGATSIEVRFKDYGVKSIEVVDNGTGISPKDYNALGLKHCTSKLSRYEDLSTIGSFGFRGEALSSLCAVCDSVVITTATSAEAPIGTTLELERDGTLRSSEVKIARQRGTTVTASGLFVPLPVRRAELTRNVKREFAKALNLLHSYALLPCVVENDGIRLSVSNQSEGGKKVVQFRTSGSPDLNSGVSSLWGPKCLTELVPVNLNFIIEPEKSLLKQTDNKEIEVSVNGLISKFSHGSGRATSDRQFFYINNRPTNSPKVQKVFNEVYHSFNINQYPFVLANISLPTNSYDVNVSPDKRTIFLHRESTLLTSIKAALEEQFSPSRSAFTIHSSTHEKGSPSRTEASQQSLPARELDSPPPSPSFPDSSKTRCEPTPLFTENQRGEDGDVGASTSGPVIEELWESCSQSCNNVSTCVKGSINSRREGFDNNGLKEGTCGPPSTSEDTLGSPENTPDQRKRKRSASPDILERREYTIPSLRPPTTSSRPSAAIQTTLTQWRGASSSNKDTSLRPIQRQSRTGSSTLADFALPGSKSSFQSDLQSSKMNTMDVDELEDEQGVIRAEVSQNKKPVDRSSISQLSHKQGNTDERTKSASLGISLQEPAVPPVGAAMDGEPSACHVGPPKCFIPSTSTLEQSENSCQPVIEIIKTAEQGSWRTSTLRFNQGRVSSRWKGLLSQQIVPTVRPQFAVARDLKVAGLSKTNQECEEVLSRVIGKEDFGDSGMQVIGQFNLGFIITRLDRREAQIHDDLFIVDQHAADEKYNFETLQQTTKIQCQSLIRPRPIELSAADEITAMDNLEILRANGFEVKVSQDVPVGKRLELVARPQSKGTVFDLTDLEELISLMQDKAPGQMVRCSKTRMMFASRACRKSIMIGKPLRGGQMTTVVRHMGTLDQPWSCPHGRPTMRHLTDLNEFAKRSKEETDWKAFGLLMASGC